MEMQTLWIGTCFSNLIEDSNISQASHQDISETYIQNTATALTVQGRVLQNVYDVVFDEDSDDGKEYNPVDAEPLAF